MIRDNNFTRLMASHRFRKILLSYFLIFFIPLVAIGYYNVSIGIKQREDRFNEQKLQKINTIQKSIEDEYMAIEKQSAVIWNDYYITRLLGTRDISNRYQSEIRAAVLSILNVKSTYDSIEDIYIILPYLDSVLYNNGLTTNDTFASIYSERNNIDIDYQFQLFEKFSNEIDYPVMYIQNEDKTQCKIVMVKDLGFAVTKPEGLLFITYNMGNSINRYLDVLANGNEMINVYDKEGNLIFNSGNLSLSENYSILESRVSSSDSFPFVFSLMYVKSNFGFSSWETLQGFLGYSSACLIIGIVLSVLLSVITYKPIKVIQKKLQSIFNEKGSLEQELVYIEKSIDTLVREKKNLALSIEEKNKRLVNVQMQMFLEGFYSNDVSGLYRSFKVFDMQTHFYRVYICYVKQRDKRADGFNDSFSEKVMNEVNVIFKNVGEDFVLNTNTCIMVFPLKDEIVLKAVHEIIEKNMAEFTVTVATSDMPLKVSEIPGIYKMFQKYIACDTFRFSKEVYIIDKNCENKHFSYSIETEIELMTSLKNCEMDSVKYILSKLWRDNSSRFNFDMAKRFHREVFESIEKVLDGEYSVSKPDRLMQYFNTNAVLTDDEVFILLLNYCENIIVMFECINNRKKDEQEMLVQRYVEDNFLCPDISLNDLASRLGFSLSKTSKYFKEVTGQGFSYYVNMMRIERAREIMVKDDITISEVAEKTGFQNYNTFRRCFLKHTGMSPITYKDNFC